MAFTYILRCRDGRYYVGSTTDLERRLAEHQDGITGPEFTRRRLPVTLVWFEEHQRIDDAFRREKQIQGWGRAKREALITGDLAALPTLARARGSEVSGGLDRLDLRTGPTV